MHSFEYCHNIVVILKIEKYKIPYFFRTLSVIAVVAAAVAE
jgi:hypothetical protein